MAGKKSIWSRIRLVYRPSKPAVKWVVLAMVVVCTVALVILGAAIRQSEKQVQSARLKAVLLKQDNDKLSRYIAELGTEQAIIRIAREELGFEDPDAIIFESVDPTDPQ